MSEHQPKPKIFLYCTPAAGWGPGDVIGCAMAEDGTGIAQHLSSSEGFAKHDMGLTSNWKHELYQKHYPEGYELEWVPTDQLETHEGFQKAWALHEAKASVAKA